MVATPIGNLGDITVRALETLRGVDAIACEDTRVTGKLCKHFGLTAPLIRYDEHSAAKARPVLMERLKRGESVALVSDAGTPLISDPGYRLVREVRAAGLPVTAAPGASALLAALTLAGLPTDRFLFAGFPPTKAKARAETLRDLAAVPATLVFYESPKRLADSLAAMAEAFGPREASVCRELTKLHEEVATGTLAELAARYAESGPPKGEVVVVVGPPLADAAPSDEAVEAMLIEALAEMRVKDAAKAVAAATGLSTTALYARAQALKDAGHGG